MLESYKIYYNSVNINIKVGDDIMLRAPEGQEPYVAKVIGISADGKQGKKNNVQIKGQWYYRPEDAKGGRRNFHGKNELFLSNHVDAQLPESIEGKCKVHTFEEYLKLDEVEDTDYFYRLEYNSNTQRFNPNRLEVACVCELPVNPDLLMVKCDGCADWFHPECVDISREEALAQEKFICIACKPMNANIQGQFSSSEKVYDKLKRETFCMRVMLLCTINNFPAYGNLSGYSLKGYKACPICGAETLSCRLTHGRKIVLLLED